MSMWHWALLCCQRVVLSFKTMASPLLRRAVLLLAALALLAAPLGRTEARAHEGASSPCMQADADAAKTTPGDLGALQDCGAPVCAMTASILPEPPALFQRLARAARYAPAPEDAASGHTLAPEPSPPKLLA
jgi:hypothetical protein